MKLTQGINFINLLRTPFCTKVFEQLFPLTFGLWIFGANFSYKNCLRKTLMKLTTVINFMNICLWLFRANKMISIYWQTAFGKWRTYLANCEQICQNSAQLFGKIQQFQSWWNWMANFSPSALHWQLFAWYRKFGEINSRCQFYQYLQAA